MTAPARAVAAAAAASPAPSSRDLLVVGPGVLGSYLGKLWKEAYPSSSVVGLTNTTNNHRRLKSLGLEPLVKEELVGKGRKFPHVAFSAPPSGSQDYGADVKEALSMWDGTGSFVFTSSMSVCPEDDGKLVQEDCALVAQGASPSTDKLLSAEKAALEGGGNVLRLVGLYHATRGAHTYFLKAKEVPRWGGYTVNLLHYEDAARLALSILRGDGTGPFRSRIFLGCDNHPVTFQDMMAACSLAKSPALSGEVTFTQPEGASKGKRANNDVTRSMLGGWTPKYESFESFMRAGGKDFYLRSGLF